MYEFKDVKRLIGRKSGDPAVQSDMKHWPFKVISANGGKPKVQVEYKGETKIFTAEEISSMVLGKMKETAERFLGHSVKDKISADDRKKFKDKCNEVIRWLDSNQAEKDEFEHRQKELEALCNPIIIRMYQSADDMHGGMPRSVPGDGSQESSPTIEEVE